MPTPEITVGLESGDRVTVTAERVERDHEDVLRCFVDDQEIAQFPTAVWAVKSDHLVE